MTRTKMPEPMITGKIDAQAKASFQDWVKATESSHISTIRGQITRALTDETARSGDVESFH